MSQPSPARQQPPSAASLQQTSLSPMSQTPLTTQPKSHSSSHVFMLYNAMDVNANNTSSEVEKMTAQTDIFGARASLRGAYGNVTYFALDALARRGIAGLERLPYTVRIILENALRHAGGELVNEDEVLSLARWTPGQSSQSDYEYPFMQARVLLQDLTGVPAVVDLAAMRSAVARMGGDPHK